MVNTATVHPVDALQANDRIWDLDSSGKVEAIGDGRISILWDDTGKPVEYPLVWFRRHWDKYGYEKEEG